LSLAEDLCSLLRGLDRAHGSYEPRGADPAGKVGGVASTLAGPLTPALWEAHLAGRRGVGVPPLLDDGTCAWGAIDVDVYDLDLPALNRRVQGLGLPLVVCRTKSGGAHLYLFFAEPVAAEAVRPKLAAWAAALGHPGVEVFPKQDYLMWRVIRAPASGPVEDTAHRDRAAAEARVTALRAAPEVPSIIIEHDVGNWLNAPYYGGEMSTRYALGPDGKGLTPAEFVALARSSAVTAEELEGLEAEAPTEDERLPEAPPCLVKLAALGFGAGMRNNGLYQLAIYARKADPEGWAQRVNEFNRTLLDPPLSDLEVRTIVRSVGRKDYQYRCTQPPFKGVCDRPTCLTREHGVGGGSSAPDASFTFGTFTKVLTNPPLWLLEVDGVTVELPTLEDFTRQAVFINRVAAAVWPPRRPAKLKPAAWERFVDETLARCEMEPVPSDATPEGQLDGHLTRFCNGRAQARTLDELLLGKPLTKDGKSYFIAADFLAYLMGQRVPGITERKLYAWLRDHQLEAKQQVLKGQKVQVWSVPAPAAQTEEFEAPRAPDVGEKF
jgi:hypothetical protein